MPFNISKLNYSTAETHHYSPARFKEKVAARIMGGDKIKWNDVDGLQSCAIRMSIALAYSGVSWRPPTKNSWRLQGTEVFFPSLASDYPNLPLLEGHYDVTKKQLDESDMRGVIYFGGGANFGASGHLTLWNGSKTHFANEAYWDQPTIRFWPMS